MSRWLLGSLAALCVGFAGCNGGSQVPVSGTVTLDEAPLAHAMVTFRPSSQKTEGLGGSGETGPDGKYVIVGARGEKGLAPGDYVVIISLRLRPDGSPADPNVPPMDSDAREKLPPQYSDPGASTLKATVSSDQAVHNFPLQLKKKK
jgi:hypothetical protein